MTVARAIAAAWQRRRRRRDEPHLDFVASRQRTPVLVWFAASAGALLLVLGARETLALQQQIAGETGRIAAHAVGTGARPAVVPARTSFGADAGRNARHLAAQAVHPWGEVFGAVESAAPDGIQWLALEHSSDRPELRLEGVAIDSATALQAVDALATRPGWSRVALTRLGSVERQGPGQRFEISARIGAAGGVAPANAESER